PLWRLYKSLKGTQGRRNREAQIQSFEKVAEKGKNEEGLREKLRRYILSMQSLFDANKSWVFLALHYLLCFRMMGRKYDLIISSSPPASVHMIGLLAKVIFKSKWIMDLRDPISQWSSVYPECKSKFRISVEDYFERKYYKKSDLIVVTAPSLKNSISNSFGVPKEKVSVIYNGYDGKLIPSRGDNISKIVGIYAGTLYFNRSPINFLLAVKRMKQEGVASIQNFHFDFFGDDVWNGYDLKEFCIKNEIDDLVDFRGYLESEKLEKKSENYNLFLNLSQKQKMQIPAKTFDYFKFDGVQVVISEPDSDLHNLIVDKNLGLSVNDKAEEIMAALTRIIESGPCSYIPPIDVKSIYSREYQNRIYLNLAEELVRLHER
ncbi:MAG: glycosyltransferase family 4 protein, partial [Algicola sp.]|nr:glycosyltransferase family 4 protein [Algicola sp.]